MPKLRGVLHFFAEMCVRGGWAFQDARHIAKAADGSERWSHLGNHLLKDGDRLTIFDKVDPSKVLWTGILRFDPPIANDDTEPDPVFLRDDGSRIDRQKWGAWFLHEFPAELEPAP